VTGQPEADELRIRSILQRRGVGPDAYQAAARPDDPAPAADPDGWWDDLYSEQPEREPEHRPAPRLPPWWDKKPTDLTHEADEGPVEDDPETAETSTDPDPEPAEPGEGPAEDDEGQVDKPRAFEPQPDYWPRPHLPAAVTHIPDQATAAISHGTRRLLYNAAAAGAGWGLGLYGQFAGVLADCGATSIGGGLVLGVGGTLLIAHVWDRRTRHWWPGIAWCARIPLATAILALALWAPAAT
jgi:hypothetical protein